MSNKKPRDLLEEVRKELEGLDRPDLAMLVHIIFLAEISGLTKELLEVVRSFYNNTIPWQGKGEVENEHIRTN